MSAERGPRRGSLRVPVELPKLPPQPLVTVLVPNYNYGRYVADAIRSATAQTYPRFEVIVCDDGSTDDSIRVIRQAAQDDDRVRLVQKENGGQASAWNAAFAVSTGDIVCLLDADDWLDRRKLEETVRFFSAEPAGALVHPLLVMDAQGREVQRLPVGHTFESGWIADRVVARGGRWGVVGGGGVCFRREVAELIFPIPEDVFVGADADAFVFRLLPLLTTVGFVDEVLYYYRLHEDNRGLARSLNLDVVARRLEFLQRTTDSVNLRLHELGLERYLLDTSKNLAVREQRLYMGLFDGGVSRGKLMREYLSLVSPILRDELYSPGRKAGLLALYGSVICLPFRARAWWLSGFRKFVYTHAFRMKNAAAKLVDRMRSPTRSSRS